MPKIMATVEIPENPGQIFRIFGQILAIFLFIFDIFKNPSILSTLLTFVEIFDYFGSFGFGFAKVSTVKSAYNFWSSFDRRNTGKPKIPGNPKYRETGNTVKPEIPGKSKGRKFLTNASWP